MKNQLALNLTTFLLCTLTFGLSAPAAHAEGPCKDKREAKSDANKAFTQCLKQWHKSMKPGEADASDDCTAKFQAVQAASKSLKACRTEALKNKEKQNNQKASESEKDE